MDLRLTNNELEIKHATKEDVIETINAIEGIICFKLNLPYPMGVVKQETEAPLDSLFKTSVEDLLDEPTTNTFNEEKTVEEACKHLEAHQQQYHTSKSEPKKKLVFDTCPDCGQTFCTMTEVVDDLAHTLHCKCGASFEAHELTKGQYTCEWGQKGFFLMTPQVGIVKCKDCKKDIYMVYDSEEKQYNGYLD